MRLPRGGGSPTFDLITEAGARTLDVVEAVQQRIAGWPSGPTQDEVKALEHAADEAVSRLVSTVNTQFVTPFDREDLIALAFAVDDVADAAENAAELFGLYGVQAPTRFAHQLANLLLQATQELAKLLARLRVSRGSAAEIVRIKEIEDEADDAARTARASLFRDDRIDPMLVIRWKGIYEALEDAVDRCETVAHLVGNILVKNA